VDGKVIVGSASPLLKSFGAETGEQDWSFVFTSLEGISRAEARDHVILTPPIVDGGTVYIQGLNELYGIDVETGEATRRLGEKGVERLTAPQSAIGDKFIYHHKYLPVSVGLESGIGAIDKSTGETL